MVVYSGGEISMINKEMSQQQLKALSDALANSDPQCGLTESEIRLKLVLIKEIGTMVTLTKKV